MSQINLDQLILNGSATLTNSNFVRLVPATSGGKAGSAFIPTVFYFNENTSFSTYFQFQISNSGGQDNGADGLVFMLQNDPDTYNAIGSTGEYLGYSNISPSIAIEFDTYYNSSWDPNNNHVGLDLNGSVDSVVTANPSLNLKTGNIINAWIDYNGRNDVIEVFLSNSSSKPQTPLLSTNVDVFDIVGSSAYVGFSGAVYSGFGNHDIRNWEFSTNESSLEDGAGLVYRFYNPKSRGHFFTTNEGERDTLLNNPQWGYVYENYGFQASEVAGIGTTPVYRFYNPFSRGHFFTASEAEKNTVLANPQWGYQFENVGFYAYGSQVFGSLPVYRFYNPFSQGHFFTINEAEKNTVLANPQWGYSFEGVGFYANSF